ncbi:CerR family C-terminal domain-containing protein [Halomonas halocynthiae]|uniref:CerR family C-terminal domain-containing protein n=1 Tax=Halomonas halocynthiae TaxID=176290 RepID=UPI0004227B39|nr:CerR family C-terminal domain-containing protein [Halomonas halocynthiae]
MTHSQSTRQRLIDAAIDLFGEQGFKGTTTRELAEAANANIGSIAYYFGNKHGLYLASTHYIADALRQRLGLPSDNTTSTEVPTDAHHARQILQKRLKQMVRIVTEDQECRRWMLLIVREQVQPSEAFDILYDRAFGYIQQGISALIARITGLPQKSHHVIVETHTLVGQVLFLLVGREVLLRRLGLTHFNDDALANIDAIITGHINQLGAANT